MNYSPLIYALHGFLGQCSDWDGIDFSTAAELLKIDIFNINPPYEGLSNWGKAFNESTKNQEGYKILMGYSLGGRLALHTLLDNPSQWKAAIFISTNTGLESDELKERRVASDLEWAARFEHENWESVMAAWNEQDVFKSTHSPFRNEKNSSRHLLASALVGWSLGRQDNLVKDLEALPIPILWVVGSRDKAYFEKAQSLRFLHPKSSVWFALDAGHRILWEQPHQLKQKIQEFISKL
jgi:2-succinyl-6-hydroxy-2,4-cyclohexadiene-1-carboxylate synthase